MSAMILRAHGVDATPAAVVARAMRVGGARVAGTPEQQRQADDDRARTRGSRLVGALYTMMGALAIGVAAGFAIDRHFGTSPGWTVGLSMLGLVVGFYHLIREAMR